MINHRVSARGSFPLIVGSTDYKTGLTGKTGTQIGSMWFRNPEYPGTTFEAKTFGAGSFQELGNGLYTIAFSNTEVGSAPGLFLYSLKGRAGIVPYYGAVQVFKQTEPSIHSRLGTLVNRIAGTAKQSIQGTQPYAVKLAAQGTFPYNPKLNNQGTFRYDAIGVAAGVGTLINRVSGSVKLAIAGTTPYKLAAAGTFRYDVGIVAAGVGTLINRVSGSVKLATTGTTPYKLNAAGTFRYDAIVAAAGVGTVINRVSGSSKLAIAGTFRYDAIVVAAGVGTVLKRITGTVSSTTKEALGVGTLLDRIVGTVVLTTRMGSVEGATFDTSTDSLEQIRNNIAGGSTPSKVAAAVWDKSTGDHTTADTFGNRINLIKKNVERGVPPGMLVAPKPIFSKEEKDKLMTFVTAIFDRIKDVSKAQATHSEITSVTGEVSAIRTALGRVAGQLQTNSIKLEEQTFSNTKRQAVNLNKDIVATQQYLTVLCERVYSVDRVLKTYQAKIGSETKLEGLVKQLHQDCKSLRGLLAFGRLKG